LKRRSSGIGGRWSRSTQKPNAAFWSAKCSESIWMTDSIKVSESIRLSESI